MHLSGEVVKGRFDPSFPCCVVSEVIVRNHGLSVACPRAVVQAKYQGMCFTAQVALNVADID